LAYNFSGISSYSSFCPLNVGALQDFIFGYLLSPRQANLFKLFYLPFGY